ncbi:hypothetical protein [Azospirillum argentinense]|uniref:glutaredoxin domain-containing protein n=1 Tax=Azospirillum argentinense TaxID=2970906 RepID=UPI0032E0042D
MSALLADSPAADTPARSYFPGMGAAVADRTVNGRKETWADVAERVSYGNALLHPADPSETRFFALEAFATPVTARQDAERRRLRHHLRQASLLMSGRHLQHGDETQPGRPMEVFTNCSTSAMRALTYRLLLNGSGVGTAYDDDLVTLADLNFLPITVCVIDHTHDDVQSGRISGYLTRRDAEHLYAGRKIVHHQVGDSREGWAKAVELMERMAFLQTERETVLLLDFTVVRPYGAPIRGMQNRPASGPGPMMRATDNAARLRDAGMEPWRAAMYCDHYFAECVLVGGARRAARMATKWWMDPTIFGFIQIKRGGFLWSSNNSVTICDAFRARVRKVREALQATDMGLFLKAIVPNIDEHGVPRFDADVNAWFAGEIGVGALDTVDLHAWKVITALGYAAFHDGTGEPGIIAVDRLTQNDAGFDGYEDGSFVSFGGADGLDEETRPLAIALARAVKFKRFKQITNPCGEISILLLGAYCVIADVVPFHAADDADAEDAFRTATRALIRTNLMRSLYAREVKRTNRIGVGITGFHEWVWARFALGFRDIIAEGEGFMLDANGQPMRRPTDAALVMWKTLARFARAVSDEARRYSAALGLVAPHTDRTFKPAGTTSKLFGLTEGAHLPSMREFLRWVQFRHDDPIVAEYAAKGYPVRQLKTYSGTTIVGFPTAPIICTLGMGDKLVTAAEATMAEQMRYLRLLETFWIRGVEEDLTPLAVDTGNQVSYTAKYDPKTTSYADFMATMIDGQFDVRCCSVMPQSDATAYEYQPEQPVTKAEYELIREQIREVAAKEDIGFEHVDCGSGACPIDFNGEDTVADTAADTVVSYMHAPMTHHNGDDPEFVVYGRSAPECPHCAEAKALLDDAGIAYLFVDLKDPAHARDFFAKRGFAGKAEQTVPKVFHTHLGHEVPVGGCKELKAHFMKPV